MCVRDGAGDQTQGSKEDINWKESLMLQSNSVKKNLEERAVDIVGGWLDMRYRVCGWRMGDPARCQQQRMQRRKDFWHYFHSTWKLRIGDGIQKMNR